MTKLQVCSKYVIALSISYRYKLNLIILKLCCFNGLLCIFISCHGGIVVHLQTLLAAPAHLFLVFFVAALAPLAAAAAVGAAETEHGGHRSVPRRHRVQRLGQKLPGAEQLGQVARAARLHHIDNDHKDNQHNDGHADANQDLPAGQRQAEHSHGHNQEAQDEVEGGKPAVLGRMVSKPSGQPDGHPHEGDWIPQQDTHDVEEEMTKCNLEENTEDIQTVSVRSYRKYQSRPRVNSLIIMQVFGYKAKYSN